MDTAKRIFSLLDKAKMEQKDFAVAVGTTDKTVSAWRTGRSKSYMKYIPAIAEALDTTAGYLLTGEEKDAPGTVSDDALKPDWLVKFDGLEPDDQQEVIAIIEMKAARKKLN